MDKGNIKNTLPEEPDPPPTQPKMQRAEPQSSRIDLETHKTHVIVIYSLSGGTGKTTIAVNIAEEIAYKGRDRVLLMDCALPAGDVGIFLNIRELQTLGSISTLIHDMTWWRDHKKLKEHVFKPQNSPAHILLTPNDPLEAEKIDRQSVFNLIRGLAQFFDFIVVDTASNTTKINKLLLEIADHILLVANPTLSSIKNLSLALELAESLSHYTYNIHLVFNKVDTELEREKIAIPIQRIESQMNRRAIGVIPRDDKCIIDAINKGQPVIDHHRLDSPAKDLIQIANAVYALCKGDTI